MKTPKIQFFVQSPNRDGASRSARINRTFDRSKTRQRDKGFTQKRRVGQHR